MKGDINKFLLPSNSTGFYLGCRTWRKNRYELLSLSSTVWVPGQPMEALTPILTAAEHRKFLYSPVATYCYGHYTWASRMGIHAWNDVDARKVIALCRSEGAPPTLKPIIGFIALWGEVVVHERGFRAQFGYPISLSDKKLAKIFGVKHIHFTSLVEVRKHVEALGESGTFLNELKLQW